MKLRLFVLLVVAALGMLLGRQPQAALAQTENETAAPAFKNVSLQINPEYDDLLSYQVPSLLVMMEGELEDPSLAPVEVKFLVPQGVGMYSAGSLEGRGGQGYTGGPPDRRPASIEGWDEITYTLTTAFFRVEYYDPNIIVGSPDKAISYDFRTVSPVSDMRVFVQEPKRATSFSVTPKGTAGRDGEGFNIFSSFYSNINSATALHFDISYTKVDDTPSHGSPASAGSSPSLIILIVILVVLIGGGVAWFIKAQKPVTRRSSGSRPQRRQAARQQGAPGKQSSGKASGGKPVPGGQFCTKCGEPLEGNAKFCPSCGAKAGG